jgi:hypothetical protein
MKQAVEDVYNVTGNELLDDELSKMYIPDCFAERFAEFIARECLNNMQNCDGDLDFAIWKTKQDFGVE